MRNISIFIIIYQNICKYLRYWLGWSMSMLRHFITNTQKCFADVTNMMTHQVGYEIARIDVIWFITKICHEPFIFNINYNSICQWPAFQQLISPEQNGRHFGRRQSITRTNTDPSSLTHICGTRWDELKHHSQWSIWDEINALTYKVILLFRKRHAQWSSKSRCQFLTTKCLMSIAVEFSQNCGKHLEVCNSCTDLPWYIR